MRQIWSDDDISKLIDNYKNEKLSLISILNSIHGRTNIAVRNKLSELINSKKIKKRTSFRNLRRTKAPSTNIKKESSIWWSKHEIDQLKMQCESGIAYNIHGRTQLACDRKAISIGLLRRDYKKNLDNGGTRGVGYKRHHTDDQCANKPKKQKNNNKWTEGEIEALISLSQKNVPICNIIPKLSNKSAKAITCKQSRLRGIIWGNGISNISLSETIDYLYDDLIDDTPIDDTPIDTTPIDTMPIDTTPIINE